MIFGEKSERRNRRSFSFLENINFLVAPTSLHQCREVGATNLPVFPHPCLYAGDFNCRHADWGYDDNSPDGECLAGWASINCLALLYNAKDAASFYSGRWNTGTNPDLAFASVGPNSRLPDIQKRVRRSFPLTTSTLAYYTTKVCYGSAKHAC